MKKLRVPSDYIAIAGTLKIPANIAEDYYLRREVKKGSDDLYMALIKLGIVSTAGEAKKLLSSAIALYRSETIFESTGKVEKAYITEEHSTYVERAHKEIEKVIGKMSYPTYSVPSNLKKNTLAVAGDFHIPFLDEKALGSLLTCGAQDLVIVADFFDMYSLSRYRQTMDYITTREEMAVARAILEVISERFRTVKILRNGNHDIRGLKKVQELMPQLIPLVVHPIESISKGLDNIEILSTPIHDTAPLVTYGKDLEIDFIGQDGDILFGHFENFCGSDGPRRVEQWIGEWDHIIKFNPKPKVVCQGHTHRLSMEYTPKGRLVIGTGCMCKPQEYLIEGHGKYIPPTVGYAILERHDGVTQPNLTQLVKVF